MKEIEIIINGDKLERVKRILGAYSDNGIFVSQDMGTNMDIVKFTQETIIEELISYQKCQSVP